MKINRLTDAISVSAQITPLDVSEVSQAGFKTIINNRPDGEAADQPETALIKAAAEQAGLVFVDLPFTAGQQTAQDVQAFAEALASQPGPVFAYCRSGMRSTSIWAMSQAPKLTSDALVATAAGAGYDIGPLRPLLDAIRNANA
ncbi:MAG: TIGR01244 family sulfur transferase [Burkholderiaceae bacterium]